MQTPQFLHERKWQVTLLLSIIVPAGVLTGLGLNSLLNKPAISQTINLDAVSWNMTRPCLLPGSLVFLSDMIRPIENVYADREISANFTVWLGIYEENSKYYPYTGYDPVQLRISPRATVEQGFVYSVTIRFSRVDGQACVNILDWPMDVNNLKINSLKDSSETEYPLIEASVVDDSKKCGLGILTYWVFLDENNKDHHLTLTLEIVYSNSTNFKKLIMPIDIEILLPRSINDSFETAEELEEGTYAPTPFHLNAYPDYYKIYVNAGQTLNVTLIPIPDTLDIRPNFDLYLYDANETLVNAAESHGCETICEESPYTGYWFVMVEWKGTYGTYILKVELYP